jgi:hypothetical protein
MRTIVAEHKETALLEQSLAAQPGRTNEYAKTTTIGPWEAAISRDLAPSVCNFWSAPAPPFFPVPLQRRSEAIF